MTGVKLMISLRRTIPFILGISLLLLTACTETSIEKVEPEETTQGQSQEEKPIIEEEQPVVDEEQPIVEEEPQEGQPPTSLEAATTVMRILKNGDMANLAAWVHPEKGLRFSPYSYVNTETDLVFSRDEVENLMNDTTVYEWRAFAGSGDLIKMTYSEYHKKFVYDADFFDTAEIALNEVLGESTTINNLHEVYPKESYDFVEYHIDGIDPAYEGMDWRSIRLVFEKMGADHALVGIIHDQWTP